jgi:hypothetical protein
MVSAIEAAVVSALLARKPVCLSETMSELADMVFAAYFDGERAMPS